MNYLLDRKIRRNKYFKYIIFVIVLFILIFFRVSVSSGLSFVSHKIFKPVLYLGNNIGASFSNIGAYFYSKKSLFLENENLKLKINEKEAIMTNYSTILDENLKLKEILNRLSVDSKEGKTKLILASILSKPNRSLYDTLIIDLGVKDGMMPGLKVFALGNIPIGRVAEVYANSSKVILYSSPGEKIEVVFSGSSTFLQMTGRGGGNFEMMMPRDFVLENGTEAVLPGIVPHTIARVQTIISDPRDSFQKVLLLSPINIFELKFVEVEK